MKRSIKIWFSDGSSRSLELKGFAVLPEITRASLSLNETKDGSFYLCVSESLIPDFSKVERLEIIRE